MAENSICSRYNPWQLWLKLCRLYNRMIERFFSRSGEFVANHPLLTILACLLLLGSLSSGFLFMKTQNRTEKLYIPQKSEAISNLQKAAKYGFYRPSRPTEVIITNKAGTNVLTKQCFQAALSLHDLITNIPGYLELCLPISKVDKPVVLNQCVTQEPLKFFNYSSDNFENLLTKLNRVHSSEDRLFRRVFGKISRNEDNQIVSSDAIRLVYYLKGFSLEEKVSEKTVSWEKEFLDKIKAFDLGRLGCGPIVFNTGRSMDDSITESTRSDVKLMSLTFTIMISFACLMLVKYRNPLTGHGLLAMGGVLCVGFGIVAGFGLSMLSKTPFVSIVGILPFLIIGVGIDDMFIIVDELDRTHPDQTIGKRLSTVMKQVGPAITMTTMTDLLAFAVGTTSKFPSVVYFCTYAALGMTFAFLFLVTLFVAYMTYDCRRMKAGRRDLIPCLKAPAPGFGHALPCFKTPDPSLVKQRWDEPESQMANKAMELWGKLLMKPTSKTIVAIVSVVLLGFGIYGTTFINEEFSRRLLAKDGSDFLQYLNALEDHFTDDIPVDIVLESGLDYSDHLTQQKINNLSLIVENNPYYRRHVVSWFNEFQKWSTSNNSTSGNASSLVTFLKRFLKSHPQFESDILFSRDNSAVEASRLYCFMKETFSGMSRRNSMVTLRNDLSEKSDLPVFASTYVFILFEQYVSTLSETRRNLTLAAVAIFVVTALFLVNPLVVLLVVLGFVSLIFELLGLMYIWGVSLNSISMVNLVLAVGFSVDYSAHIAHAFVFSSAPNPEEKVINALRTMGASVFMGGFSTFLGMLVTGFGSSEIFRIFFKMFFGIVVLGLLHGLCFLPVWLSILCRQKIDIVFQEQEEKQDADHDLLATLPM